MIVIHNKMLFIHIPRTSGNSIYNAFGGLFDGRQLLIAATTDHFSLSCAVNKGCSPCRNLCNRHTRIADIAVTHSEVLDKIDAGGIYAWTVVRNPWSVVASTYRLNCDAARVIGDDPKILEGAGPDWRKYISRFMAGDRAFDSYVRDFFEYLRPAGGFYHHWCCHSGREYCEPYRFEDFFAGGWGRLRGELRSRGIRVEGLPWRLPHRNQVPAVEVEWTKDLIEFVGEFAREDVRRFGFRPPPMGR